MVTLLIATRFIRGSIVVPFQKKTIASFVYGCFEDLIDEKVPAPPELEKCSLSSRVTGFACWMKEEERKRRRKEKEKEKRRPVEWFFRRFRCEKIAFLRDPPVSQ